MIILLILSMISVFEKYPCIKEYPVILFWYYCDSIRFSFFFYKMRIAISSNPLKAKWDNVCKMI